MLPKASEVDNMFSRARKGHVHAVSYWDRFNVSGALVREKGKKIWFPLFDLCNRYRLPPKVSEVDSMFSRARKGHVHAVSYWDRFNVSGALVREKGKNLVPIV